MTNEQMSSEPSDRPDTATGPRRLEVVKKMTDTYSDTGQGHTAQEISQLFEIVSRENEVIAGLAGGMDQLRAVQAAKSALAKLSPTEVRAALTYRRTLQTGPSTCHPGASHAAEELS